MVIMLRELSSTTQDAEKISSTALIETPENVEIQQELDDIKKQLDLVKNKISTVESTQDDASKETHKTELDGLITTTKQKIAHLENDTTLSIDQKQVLSDSKTALTHLEAKVKPWYEKAWDWTEEKVDKAWDYAKKNPGKAALIATGVWALAWGLWSWFKGDKKKEDASSDAPKEKKSFWDTWYGKALKWGGIGTWLYFLFKYLFTGKLSDSPWEKPADLVDAYNKLEKNEREQYAMLGTNIDGFYDDVFKAEVQTGWDNAYDMSLTSEQSVENGWKKAVDNPTGVIPFAVDKTFGSVDKLLSEEGIKYMVMSNDISYYKTLILGWGEQKIASFLLPYLEQLPSWTLIAGQGWTLTQIFEKWIANDPTVRLKELQTFFRQYSKVLTYMNDKKDQLQYKIATQAWNSAPAGFASVDDAMQDHERFEKYVLKNPLYTSFLAGSLYSAISTLNTQWLLTKNLSDKIAWDTWLSYMIAVLDDDRKQILDEEDNGQWTLDLALGEIASGTVSSETQKDLKNIAERLERDVTAEFDQSFLYGVFGPGVGALLNSDEFNLQQFLKETGMDLIRDEFKEKFSSLQKDIDAGSLTKEKLQAYKQLANDYFAFKKECMISGYTLAEVKSENIDLVSRLTTVATWLFETVKKHGFKSLDNLQQFDSTGNPMYALYAYLRWLVPVVAGSYVLERLPMCKWLGQNIRKLYTQPAIWWAKLWYYAATESGLMGTRYLSRYSNNPFLLRKFVYDGAEGANRLAHDVLSWKLSIDVANAVLKRKEFWLFGQKVNAVLDNTLKKIDVNGKPVTYSSIYDLLDKELTAFDNSHARVLLWDGIQMNFLENASLRNKLFEIEPNARNSLFRQRSYVISFKGSSHMDILVHYRNGLSSLDETHKILSQDILRRLDFSKVDIKVLSTLNDQIAKIPVATLKKINLSTFADEIVKDVSILSKKSELLKLASKVPAAEVARTVEHVAWSVDDIALRIRQSEDTVTKLTTNIFADFDKTLAKQARKHWFKPWSDGYKLLSEKLWDSPQYGKNQKLLDAIAQHNDFVKVTEKTLLEQFNQSNWAQKQALYHNNDILKKIVDANGGLDVWKKLPWRTWRIVSVGIHAVMLAWIGSSKDEHGKDKEWGTIWWEAADFGFGMVPFAGWVYDLGMAIYGKDLNGREMGWRERWIRWVVWVWSTVADFFTFGLWGTALRWLVKWWTKVALKTWTKTVVKEWVEVVSKWALKWFGKQLLKNTGRDILIGTTAWLVLIPIVNTFDQVALDPATENTEWIPQPTK